MLNLWHNGQVLVLDLNHNYQEKYNLFEHLIVYQEQNSKYQQIWLEYRIQ
jgi:hypothetical protein